MTLRAEIIDDPARLEPLVPAWDDLAVAAAIPYAAPEWQLAWWRHAAPADAHLRVVAAWDGDRLAGIAPFFAAAAGAGTWRYALLASPVSSRLRPLAAAAERERCAEAFAAALAGATPRPHTILLSQIPEGSAWPGLLRDAWPDGAPSLHHEVTVPAPVVRLEGDDLDQWLAQRSSNFRSQVRGARRKLEARGGSIEAVAAEGLDDAVAELLALHASRHRGGSEITEGVEGMLAEAGRSLVPRERMLILRSGLEDDAVAATLFLTAGGQMTFWNGGFDDTHADLRPGLVTLVEAVGRALACRCASLDLGPGDSPYKRRLTDEAEQLATWALVPPGPGALRARGVVGFRRFKRATGQRLGEERKQRLKRLLNRG